VAAAHQPHWWLRKPGGVRAATRVAAGAQEGATIPSPHVAAVLLAILLTLPLVLFERHVLLVSEDGCAEERHRHHDKQIRAERHNRRADEQEASIRKSVDAVNAVAKQQHLQRLHVLPWDATAMLERIKSSSLCFKALQVELQMLGTVARARARACMTRTDTAAHAVVCTATWNDNDR
jgi:hypothetical protein